MRMRTTIAVTCAAALALLLASCAPEGNELMRTPNGDGIVAGFWRGLWHGIIAPVTFIISLFTRSVGVYEVHNNGGWYNFGFLLGVSCALGGGPASRAARRSRRRHGSAI
ncbi:MAG TPA: hypothetical protein VE549_15440 [Myxococcaceae bacterium]|nr:hypothetical protein [Myxococcaceae bacterium]